VFRGIALRLEGVEALRKAFETGDQDPALAGALAAVYNGTFDLTAGDLELLLDMVTAYLANTAKWIAAMDRDEWKSDLDTLVATLAEGAALVPDRQRARDVLAALGASRADRDTKQTAKKLLAEL
jgi:Ser/Thr protein kinase RdoA (MazF antagonist)